MEFPSEARLSYIKASGTHYEVGLQIGRTMKEGLKKALKEYKYLKERLIPYVTTGDTGKSHYEKFLNTVEKRYPQYVRELQGIADGAEVDFMNLMLLNFEPELSILLGDKPPCHDPLESNDTRSGQSPGSVGCTDIYLKCSDTGCNALVHTEDSSPELCDTGILIDATIYGAEGIKPERNSKAAHDTEDILPELCDTGILVDATINGAEGIKSERFIGYTVAGVLIGGMFGINNSGYMYSCNHIFQKHVNINGIPRRFLLRAMVAAKDPDEVISIAKCSEGIGSAYNLNMMYKTGENIWKYTWLELAASTSDKGPVIRFNHLCTPHHLDESSLRRKYTIDKLAQKIKPTSKADLLHIISNQDDTEFPIFRSGASSDYLAFNAAGLFDLNTGTMSIYTSKPDSSDPLIVINASDI